MQKTVVSIMLMMLAGCRVINTESIDRMSTSTRDGHVLVDSIFLKDSVIIRETSDTVFLTKYHTVYKERWRMDTVVRCDTVYRENVVTAEKSGSYVSLWWLLIPFVVVMWKVGLFDLIRSLIMKNIKG